MEQFIKQALNHQSVNRFIYTINRDSTVLHQAIIHINVPISLSLHESIKQLAFTFSDLAAGLSFIG
jgi:hypothetical protein